MNDSTAVIEFAMDDTQLGSVVIRLYEEEAPETVASFIRMAKAGLYDGRQIRRIVPDFVLQPSYTHFDDPRCDVELVAECALNAFVNRVPFEKGTVAMSGDRKIASGSEFYIVLSDGAGKRLSGNFAAFGKVISGWDVVERITNLPLIPVPNDDGVEINVPKTPVYMKRVNIEKSLDSNVTSSFIL